MDIKIRPAQEKDAERIEKLLVQIGIIHNNGRPDIFEDNVIKYKVDDIKNMLKDINSPIFVAHSEDLLLGYIFFKIKVTKNNPTLKDMITLYIDDLCIDENYRGQNIGGILLSFAKTYAKEINAFNIELNVWEFNIAAKNFYEKSGFSTQKRNLEYIID